MTYQKSEFYFLLALISGVSLLSFFIFQPFLYPLVMAVIFATVFMPVHRRMLVITREKSGLAALLSILFVLVIVVVPITFLLVQIFKEATQLYSSLASNGGTVGFYHGVEGAVARMLEKFSVVSGDSFSFNRYIEQGSSWLIQNLGPLFSNVTKMIVDLLVFLAALFYLFKDGKKLKKVVVTMSPLHDAHDETIFNKFSLAINSVVKGSLAVGIGQGVLTATGFAVFGVPNPVLWGSVTAVASLIPGVGTALVVLPAILFLFFKGEASSAAGLLFWGMTAVGLVDNVLGPKLVEKGVRIHPFLILLSILGGVSFFGPLGFLFGPLVLSLLFVLFEIYFTVRAEHNK